MAAPQPSDYARRLLVAAVGLTPQVVTETLYALAMRPDPFVPTELHIITTLEGARRIRLTLLEGDQPQLPALARDLGRDDLAGILTAERLHVIRGDDRRPLADIASAADNRAAADAITQIIRRLTADPAAALHASIAGGRKTMGFLLGYALSLYGRPQDALSHVLVDEPFQSHPDFFFPPRQPRVLMTRDQRPMRTDEAVITLADIPFVRLRHGLPQDLLDGNQGYTATVAAAQAALAPPSLLLDRGQRRLVCHGREIRLQPLLLAFYACFIHRRVAQEPAIAWTGLSAAAVLDSYQALFGPGTPDFDRVRKALHEGMTKPWFEQKKAALNRALKDSLGPAADAYLLQPIGRRPTTGFTLTLGPDCITLK